MIRGRAGEGFFPREIRDPSPGFAPLGAQPPSPSRGEGGTALAAGKESREINGRMYVLEYPIHADFAFIKAERGDRWGNLTYRMTARNFGPIMASAAATTVASVHEVVELGQLDPESIVTPGIFVQHVVPVPGWAGGR